MSVERERDEGARFPILAGSENARSVFGASIPWSVVEVVRAEAMQAHDQSLEVLAQRGGLTWAELGSLFVAHHAAPLGFVRKGSLEWRQRV